MIIGTLLCCRNALSAEIGILIQRTEKTASEEGKRTVYGHCVNLVVEYEMKHERTVEDCEQQVSVAGD